MTYTQGNGTKKDPNVVTIKANYYYNTKNLTEKQIAGLNSSIAEYNNTQTTSGKEKDGNYTVIKYDLTAKGFDNDEDVNKAASADQYDNAQGGTSRFGNIITATDDAPSGKEGENTLGEDDGRYKITLFNANIKKATDAGNDEGMIFKSIFNHEIGHNLGGEHGDASPMASSMTFGRQKPDCQLGNCWEPYVPNNPISSKLAPTLLDRMEKPVDRKRLRYVKGSAPSSSQ